MALKFEVNKFRKYRIILDKDVDQEVVKEAFWLNCLNFMTLFKIAEIMLV
jgi:hypothetical protein